MLRDGGAIRDAEPGSWRYIPYRTDVPPAGPRRPLHLDEPIPRLRENARRSARPGPERRAEARAPEVDRVCCPHIEILEIHSPTDAHCRRRTPRDCGIDVDDLQ